MSRVTKAEVIIIGGGIAGLSAAIYLGRAKRETLVVDSGRSMARWEPDVQNYLGFPGGIAGSELLRRAREQARRYRVRFVRDEIVSAKAHGNNFSLRGRKDNYSCHRLLLATGIFHVPPDIAGVQPCLGHSMFFCKDCDGYRVSNRNIGIYGWTNETVEYALAMLTYSNHVAILTNGRKPRWSRRHRNWIRTRGIPVYRQAICHVSHCGGQIQALAFDGGKQVCLEALFTTRGDIYFSKLAEALGARLNRAGEIVIRLDMRTTVPGLYAAGCVTPANCQMIIAAGQGATAAQAINRNLFEESLTKSLTSSAKGKPAQSRVRLRTRPHKSSKKQGSG
ncbi:MAG TPA: NAD(P)/FAD-dependent oxidoreductase [Verrucomicrobiae bacterium]|jgi:thioredoxin reductase (NADPH)|nr:NAD(P)/FAD-dependent oxidoreductase [Verrucomicrobiae bacterium]